MVRDVQLYVICNNFGNISPNPVKRKITNYIMLSLEAMKLEHIPQETYVEKLRTMEPRVSTKLRIPSTIYT
jgi:hypothetical protein